MAESQYLKLARLLDQRIRAGEHPVGSRIPSERALCELYGVSRITVRQAIAELVNRGVLRRAHGRGTFVAAPRVEQSLLDHFTYAEQLRSNGLLVASTVLEQRRVPASTEVASQLRLAASAPVLRLVRQRKADGEPYALETTHLPLERLPEVENADFTGDRSLYEVLATEHGVRPTRAREWFEPVLVKAAEAGPLGVSRNSPALLVTRSTEDEQGQPVEFAKAVIRGDRCRMLVELKAGVTAGWAD